MGPEESKELTPELPAFFKPETKLEIINRLVGAHGFRREGVKNGMGLTLVVTSPRHGGGYVAFLAPRDEPWEMTQMICDDDGWRYAMEQFDWFPLKEGDTPMTAFVALAKMLNRLPEDEDLLWKWAGDVHQVTARLVNEEEINRFYADLKEFENRDYLSKS